MCVWQLSIVLLCKCKKRGERSRPPLCGVNEASIHKKEDEPFFGRKLSKKLGG